MTGATSRTAQNPAADRPAGSAAGTGWLAALCRDKVGLISLGFVVLVLLAGLCAPLVAPMDPLAIDTRNKLAGCSWEHWLGTDHLGRDILSRLVYGARTTLVLALATMLVTVCLGSVLGLVAGYARGLVDSVIMRVCDVLMSFPSEVLILALVGMAGPGLENVLLACLLAKWPWYARMVRSIARQYAESNFVRSARVAGFSSWYILRRHILPCAAGEIVVLATLDCAALVLLVSTLSFLGLGVQPPVPEWGMMLAEARNVLVLHPWQMLPPGLTILAVVAAFNFLGDALRDALDPWKAPGKTAETKEGR